MVLAVTDPDTEDVASTEVSALDTNGVVLCFALSKSKKTIKRNEYFNLEM